jgi:hypothetical protein
MNKYYNHAQQHKFLNGLPKEAKQKTRPELKDLYEFVQKKNDDLKITNTTEEIRDIMRSEILPLLHRDVLYSTIHGKNPIMGVNQVIIYAEFLLKHGNSEFVKSIITYFNQDEKKWKMLASI